MMREGAKTHIGALSPVRARVSSSPLMSTNNKYYVVFRGRNHFANRSSLAKSLKTLTSTFNIMQLMRVRCMFRRIFGADLPRFCDLTPPLFIFAAGANAYDLPTHPQAPRPQTQVLT